VQAQKKFSLNFLPGCFCQKILGGFLKKCFNFSKKNRRHGKFFMIAWVKSEKIKNKFRRNFFTRVFLPKKFGAC
jgi:hypothetical protein